MRLPAPSSTTGAPSGSLCMWRKSINKVIKTEMRLQPDSPARANRRRDCAGDRHEAWSACVKSAAPPSRPISIKAPSASAITPPGRVHPLHRYRADARGCYAPDDSARASEMILQSTSAGARCGAPALRTRRRASAHARRGRRRSSKSPARRVRRDSDCALRKLRLIGERLGDLRKTRGLELEEALAMIRERP